MNRKQKIIVSVTGIFIVLLALVGITFAYFLTRIQGNTNTTSISVTTADLKLVYGDGNNAITGINVEPGWTNDGASGRPAPKTFTVTNQGNETVEGFNIYLEDVRNSIERKEDLIYTITCENTTPGATSTECEDFDIVENEVTSEDELIFPSVMSIIATDTLEPATEDTNAEIHTYTITVTYKNLTDTDQSIDMGKAFSAKVNIYDGKTKFLTTEIMKNAKSTETVDYNKSTYVLPSMLGTIENTSVPAEEISLENERILSYSFDNDGTSYYFRGNVEDNYVTFSNKCWRIVRIQGDGSIKLTLESQSPCSENMTSDFSIGFADWGYYKNANNKYIGDYNNKSEVSTSATTGMKNMLTTWLNETEEVEGEQVRKNITTNAEKLLKTEDWCLGNVTNTYAYSSPYALLGTTATQNYASGTKFYYETGRNLLGKGVTPNATLICNGESDSSKIGALTADEVVFAGGKTGISNKNYYLQNNSYYWWTLSRSSFNGTYDTAFGVGDNGVLNDGDRVNDDLDVRPAVSLNTGVKITSGEGTKGNPYIINEG